jgi:hypothetical protein
LASRYAVFCPETTAPTLLHLAIGVSTFKCINTLRASGYLSEGAYGIAGNTGVTGATDIDGIDIPVYCRKCNTSTDNGHPYYLTFAATIG